MPSRRTFLAWLSSLGAALSAKGSQAQLTHAEPEDRQDLLELLADAEFNVRVVSDGACWNTKVYAIGSNDPLPLVQKVTLRFYFAERHDPPVALPAIATAFQADRVTGLRLAYAEITQIIQTHESKTPALLKRTCRLRQIQPSGHLALVLQNMYTSRKDLTVHLEAGECTLYEFQG